MKHVLIVGGGVAGVHCALKLAQQKDVRVTLLDHTDYFQYKALFYQVASGEECFCGVAPSFASIFEGKDNIEVFLEEVISINPQEKSVLTRSGKCVSGDILVLACGSQPNFFGIPGAAEHSLPLYSFKDAERLRNHIVKLFLQADSDPQHIEEGSLNYVVVGAGPTGVELVGGLAETIQKGFDKQISLSIRQKATVYLVDFLPEIIPVFSKNSRLYAEKELAKRGVKLRLGVAVKEVFRDHVLLSDGSSIPTSTVVWAAGSKAAPLVAHSGLPTGKGGRVEVGRDLSVKGFPSIFALGDCANIQKEDGSFLPQLGAVAKECGLATAHNIIRRFQGEETRPFHYKDRGIIALIGHRSAVANLGKRKIELTGFLASIAWLIFQASLLPKFRQRLEMVHKWAWKYFG